MALYIQVMPVGIYNVSTTGFLFPQFGASYMIDFLISAAISRQR